MEDLLSIISDSFALRFPPGALDEVLKLDELCMVASWMKGLYKRPDFMSADVERRCTTANPSCARLAGVRDCDRDASAMKRDVRARAALPPLRRW